MAMEHDECKAGGDSEDKMVKFELEAAEALAGLAHSSMQGEEEEEEPERPTHQRVKHGSSSPRDYESATQPCGRDSDLPQQDRTIVIQELSEKVFNVITKTVKDEKDEHKSGDLCSTSYLSLGGSKSRQPLTKIEKEAQRLRRVLANRESARQTIRRRQAMFEELTRKAADLALENESLKREKELAVKEYDSLKSTNDCLKKQMAKMVKPKTESPNRVECSASASSRTPFPSYNQPPPVPLHWPSIIQPLDATLFQSRSPYDIANPSLFSMTPTWRPELFSGQRDSTTIANPGALLYVLPFPCFFPLHPPTNAFHPQSPHQNDRQNQNNSNNLCNASSSLKNSARREDFQPSLSLKVKSEASDSTPSIPAADVHQAGLGFPPDGGGGNIEGTYPNRMVLMPTPLSCVRPPASVGAELNTTVQQNNASTNVEAVASFSGQRHNCEREEYQEAVDCSSKIPADASTAAEARRRRKELMKLKVLQAVKIDSKQGAGQLNREHKRDSEEIKSLE